MFLLLLIVLSCSASSCLETMNENVSFLFRADRIMYSQERMHRPGHTHTHTLSIYCENHSYCSGVLQLSVSVPTGTRREPQWTLKQQANAHDFEKRCSNIHISVFRCPCVSMLCSPAVQLFQFIPPSCLELASRAINVELHGFSYGVT